jgi:hypothetical protein
MRWIDSNGRGNMSILMDAKVRKAPFSGVAPTIFQKTHSAAFDRNTAAAQKHKMSKTI